MRNKDRQQREIFPHVSMESMLADHPLSTIRAVLDEAMSRLDDTVDQFGRGAAIDRAGATAAELSC